MLMYYSLILPFSFILLSILIINKDITLKILSNITFKWVFEKKKESSDNKQETQIQLKDINKLDLSDKSSLIVGYTLLLISCLLLLVSGISYIFADFQFIGICDDITYMDDPNLGRILIVIDVIVISLTIFILTLHNLLLKKYKTKSKS